MARFRIWPTQQLVTETDYAYDRLQFLMQFFFIFELLKILECSIASANNLFLYSLQMQGYGIYLFVFVRRIDNHFFLSQCMKHFLWLQNRKFAINHLLISYCPHPDHYFRNCKSIKSILQEQKSKRMQHDLWVRWHLWPIHNKICIAL